MSKPIQLAATLEGVSTLKDGGMTIRFHSQEMSHEEKVILLDYLQKFGWLLFKEAAFADSEVPDYDPKQFDESKSPSQRLKGIIYIHSQQKGVDKKDFPQFYKDEMDKICEGYKRKYLDS